MYLPLLPYHDLSCFAWVPNIVLRRQQSGTSNALLLQARPWDGKLGNINPTFCFLYISCYLHFGTRKNNKIYEVKFSVSAYLCIMSIDRGKFPHLYSETSIKLRGSRIMNIMAVILIIQHKNISGQHAYTVAHRVFQFDIS